MVCCFGDCGQFILFLLPLLPFSFPQAAKAVSLEDHCDLLCLTQQLPSSISNSSLLGLTTINICRAAPKISGTSDLTAFTTPVTQVASSLLQSSLYSTLKTAFPGLQGQLAAGSQLFTLGGCLQDVHVRSVPPTCHPISTSCFGFLSLAVGA